MKLGDRLPPFDASMEWLIEPSAGPAAFSRPQSTPILVHFWSSDCPLCHDGARQVARWRRRFAPLGLRTIAIYQPRRSDARLDTASLRDEARRLMLIDDACALDRDGGVGRRFDNPYAPGYYVFDRAETLRHRQMGNAALAALEPLLERIVQASPAPEAY